MGKLASFFRLSGPSEQAAKYEFTGLEEELRLIEHDESDHSNEDEKPAEVVIPKDLIPAQAAILEQQVAVPEPRASFFQLYRFARPVDFVWLAVATVFAVIHGAALPLFTVIVGNLTNDMDAYVTSVAGKEEFMRRVDHNTLYFVYLGIALIVSGMIQSFIFVRRGEILASRFRKQYLHAIMAQNVAFFDKIGSGEITTHIVSDTSTVQDAISEKSGMVISGISTFISAIVVALAVYWRLALILISGVIFLTSTMSLFSLWVVKYSARADSVFHAGASVAEEALSLIKTTMAFSLQGRLAAKFDIFLGRSERWGNRTGLVFGMLMASAWSSFFWIFALAFWQGSRYIASGQTNVGKVLAVASAIIIGAFELGEIAPQLQYVFKGIGACQNLRKAIERVPPLSGLDTRGETLPEVTGNIAFNNIDFRYPSRPDVAVLADFSLSVPAGKTVALVGASGSGKSTLVGLLERFYLPLAGSVTLDGVDIATLNVSWLRQQMGYVAQEPTLFATSIYENVAYGLRGSKWESASDEVKRSKVIEACKLANAWGFVEALSDGLETNVGEAGLLLSGGQKQRIAIARAIVSDPKILLLDEATSALDTVSEGVVQEALDRAAANRTTIVIAHRLSTIKDADVIVVMSKGEIVEQGTHNELLADRGAYAQLVEMQQIKKSLAVTDSERAALSEKKELLAGNSVTVVSGDAASDSSSFLTRTEPKDLSEDTRGTKLIDSMPSTGQIIKMIWSFNARYWKLALTAMCFAAVMGYGYPSLSLVMGKSVSAMMVRPEEYPTMRRHMNLYSGMFFMQGCILLVCALSMGYLFALLSDRMVRNVKLALFKQYIRMDASFYDLDTVSSGALVSSLGSDGKAIEGIGGATLGHLTQSVVLLIAGVITALIVNWRLGLVGMACVPIVVGCGFFRYRVMAGLEQRASEVYRDSANLATQSATAIRTVQTLAREAGVIETYTTQVDEVVRTSRLEIARAAVAYGFSKGLSPWVTGLVFWYGAKQLVAGNLTSFAFFVVLEATVFGAETAGAIFSYAPNFGQARRAARDIYRAINTVPVIDSSSEDGAKFAEPVKGSLVFENVVFRYPTRPGVPVLTDLSLSVEPGQYVAVVGPSGSGKSTTIGMVERFYDPLAGSVKLDGTDVRDFNIRELRAQMALVQQEPALYAGTIRENVLMGWDWEHYPEPPSEETIRETCRLANIHDFIMSLPQGYSTPTGARGVLLSGGQKQRIAIARALIRNPRVLLLDEATSALDSESEKVVQRAIDAAARGRTTIAVAHRLATVQHADKIFVIDGGVVAESGTHSELIEAQGIYAELAKLQSLVA